MYDGLCYDSCAKMSQCHTFTLSHCHTFRLSHCHTSHCHSIKLSHWNTETLSNCHTFSVSHQHTVTRSHFHTVTISQSHTVTLFHLAQVSAGVCDDNCGVFLRHAALALRHTRVDPGTGPACGEMHGLEEFISKHK